VRLIFHPHAWEDYLSWVESDRKTLRKINELIRDIARSPFDGLGKPEALRFELTGSWSRRIDQEHRLVYRVEGDDLHILACRYHY
jgi:toxin YoeB